MQVSVDRGKKIDNSWPKKPKPGEQFFPDALASETVYRVVGKATNEAETCASADIISGSFSNARQVRFRLFRWPNEDGAGLLAVLQYDLLGANPAMSCPSLGVLVHLVRNAASWKPRNEYLLQTVHHFSLQRIELLDLTGNGPAELVIESDLGGAGTGASSLQVFDLSRGRFEERLHTYSRFSYLNQDVYTQVLDIGRTRQSHGQRFCCSKTIRFEKGKWSEPPRIVHPCYQRGDGVDAGDVSFSRRMLAPLN